MRMKRKEYVRGWEEGQRRKRAEWAGTFRKGTDDRGRREKVSVWGKWANKGTAFAAHDIMVRKAVRTER